MEKIKKFFTSIPGIILIFVVAAVPLLIGSIGSARAALTYYSDTHISRVGMNDIGVTLLENGVDSVISYRDYITDKADGSWNEHTGALLLKEFKNPDGTEAPLKFGKKYTEELAVRNSGTIGSYVRASIYKYWIDADGNKAYDIDPKLIDVIYKDGSGWFEDENARTAERRVWYYSHQLPVGATTTNLTEGIVISGDIQGNVTVTNDGKGNIKTTYNYNDYQFIIEVTVDAVQDHNAEAAIKSAWGVDMNVVNETLSF